MAGVVVDMDVEKVAHMVVDMETEEVAGMVMDMVWRMAIHTTLHTNGTPSSGVVFVFL